MGAAFIDETSAALDLIKVIFHPIDASHMDRNEIILHGRVRIGECKQNPAFNDRGALINDTSVHYGVTKCQSILLLATRLR